MRASFMAIRDHNAKKKDTNLSFSCRTSSLLLALLCFVSLFFIFSASKGSTKTSLSIEDNLDLEKPSLCDYTDGTWIYDPTLRSSRYDNTCKEIFKGWNCISSNKSNARDIINWRWKPSGCYLPPFDPIRFLQRFRNTNIGFVGDSLNRNMFVSLVRTLKQVSNEVRKWRPAGADRGGYLSTLQPYCCVPSDKSFGTLWWSANANGCVLESIGYKQGFRVDVDIPEGTWVEAPSFHDILILNTGHWWWAPSKFDPINSPMLFFEKGLPVIVPPMRPDLGLDMVLKHMVSFVERRMRPGAIKFFCTQSPRHFEGGDWDQGGSCQRVHPLLPNQVEELFSLESNGTNVEVRLVNQHLYKALKGSSFRILYITHMSEFRADAHPSTAGGKKHNDCMHRCLLGVTDTWNDLFVAYLNNI